jgi:isoquinoline 1-oxidoreductase beta subunit
MGKLRVNRKSYEVEVEPHTPLLWVLRDKIGLKGTKYGCGIGKCGICMAHVNGKPVRTCVLPVGEIMGQEVTTIEGVSANHPVIQAWIAEQVPQCGYCQPGQVMAAMALLASNPFPDDSEVAAVMSGVLCRCGTYPRIKRAIRRAASYSATGHTMHTASRRDENRVLTAILDREDGVFAPNPWVRIDPNGSVTVLIDRSEMGQGVATSLAMLMAEELEVDLGQLRIVFAPTDSVYRNPIIGEQLTGGSTSVRGAWEILRQAGAQAREVLICAAAATWDVSSADCKADKGRVIHVPTGRTLGFGELVDKACRLTVPQNVTLKSPKAFRLIGHSVPRIEIPAMVSGKTVFGSDVEQPGLRVAMIERCPILGGRLSSYDPTETLQVNGVRKVIEVSTGIAVVADDTFAAIQGRRALKVVWKAGSDGTISSKSIRQQFVRAAKRPGQVELDIGHTHRALAEASLRLERAYDTPYLAHGCMEPMNCTAYVTDNGCDIWVGTQAQTATQEIAARLTGLAREHIRIHTQFLGGGFGRRGETDFVAEAVEVAQHFDSPVKLLWTRQDDFRHDRYRPANYTELTAGLDSKGRPVAWFQRVVGPSLSLDGVKVPYDIPNIRVEYVREDPGIPTGAWRSVGPSQNAFSVECFIDELAYTAGCDPFEYRLDLLRHAPSQAEVLKLAAEKAGWGMALRPGCARGMAFYESFKSSVAQVVEISVSGSNDVQVHRVVCAIDCGITVNPDTVVSQMEGGIIFGLSAAIQGEITIKDSQIEQSSFEDYPIFTLADTPEIEVYIVTSDRPPGGVGEPPVPPIGPAVANAVFAATGQRLRELPLRIR